MKNKNLFLLFYWILSIGIVSAESITFVCPEKAMLNEEFEVGISLINFSSGVYDVKIDLIDNDIRIAQIFNNNEWKSTYYYVNDILSPSEEKDFSLKIIKEFEEAIIEVKIKNSNGDVKTFTDYKINFDNTPPVINNSLENPPTGNIEIEENETNNFEELADENGEAIEEETKEIEEIIEEKNIINLTPISLNAKSIKSEDNKEILKSKLSFYGIITLCLMFGTLLLLKNRKRKNEFN